MMRGSHMKEPPPPPPLQALKRQAFLSIEFVSGIEIKSLVENTKSRQNTVTAYLKSNQLLSYPSKHKTFV